MQFVANLKRMRNITTLLKNASGAENKDNLDVDNLFNFFVIGILYDLISLAKCNDSNKAAILDFALKHSSVDINLSGYDVIEHMTKGIESAELIRFTTNIKNGIYGFWGIVVIMGNKSGHDDDALNFFEQCTGYMTGIENVLADKFPNVGFGDISRKYMLEKSRAIYNWISET